MQILIYLQLILNITKKNKFIIKMNTYSKTKKRRKIPYKPYFVKTI